MKSEIARACLDKCATTLEGRTMVSYNDALRAIEIVEKAAEQAIAAAPTGMGIMDLKKLEAEMQWYMENVPTLWNPAKDAYRAGVHNCITLLKQAVIDKFTTAERRAAEE